MIFYYKYFFQLEKQLENIGVRSQKELILLHREDASKGFRISHTVDWLNARGWICAHHHVRFHFYTVGNRFLLVITRKVLRHADRLQVHKWRTMVAWVQSGSVLTDVVV